MLTHRKTAKIVLCELIFCTPPACFSTFYWFILCPYFGWKFLIFSHTSLLTFLEIIITTGKSTQNVSKASHAPVYQLSSEKGSSHYASLPAVFNPLPSSMDREVLEKQLCNQSS